MATLMCAVFENTRTAEAALRALEADGFPRRQMGLRSGDQLRHRTEPREPARAGSGRDERVWDRVRSLFQNQRSSNAHAEADRQSVSADMDANTVDADEIVLILATDDDRVGQAAETDEAPAAAGESSKAAKPDKPPEPRQSGDGNKSSNPSTGYTDRRVRQ